VPFEPLLSCPWHYWMPEDAAPGRLAATV